MSVLSIYPHFSLKMVENDISDWYHNTSFCFFTLLGKHMISQGGIYYHPKKSAKSFNQLINPNKWCQNSKISEYDPKGLFYPPGPPAGIFFWTIDNFFDLKIPVRDTHSYIGEIARLSMHFWLLKVLQATKIVKNSQKFHHRIEKISKNRAKWSM